MFFLGIIFFTIVVVTIWYFVAKRRTEYGTVNVNENDLIKKFNRVVKRLTERNIENVKADLFKILDRYKFIKCEQFIENRTQIQSARKQVTEQIEQTIRSRSDVRRQVQKLKESGNPDANLGAQLVYQYDMLGEMIEKLEVAKDNLTRKECEFDRELGLFNSKFALKKAEVSMMIANAISLKNISSIDIRLEDLVSEFQQKVDEQENADYVRTKLYGTATVATETSFDVDAYKQKFADFQ
jgi:hypothetical protein